MAHIFSGSQGVVVHNSSFHVNTAYHTSGSRAFNTLVQAVSPNAFHNSDDRPDPPKCHQNTRVAVINKILDWIQGEIDTEAFILWFYGPAGAGKSAIARTVAEICEARSLLLASFFFFRTDPRRNTVKPMVASIAYRIALTIPPSRALIESVIDSDPVTSSFRRSVGKDRRRGGTRKMRLRERN